MREVEDFLRQTALVDPRFIGSVDFREFIAGAFTYAEAIWQNPVHLDYVDHGLEHSYHALRKARLILDQVLRKYDGEELSDLERAILTVAALVHDTGMQWDKYVTKKERQGVDKSRHNHVANSHTMIELAMAPESKSIPSIAHLTAYHSFFGSAARIGMAHSGPAVWKQLTELQEDDWGISGQPLRFKLLAAAFRLADEIDNAFTRILDPSRLEGDALEAATLAHWDACYYIEDVRIANAATGLIIEIFPRLPLDGPPDLDDEIIYLIDTFRMRRIHEECARVVPFLRTSKTSPPLAEPRRVQARRRAVGAPPKRVRELIRSMRTAESVTELATPEPARRTNVIGAADESLKKACKEMEKAEAAGTLYSAGHVALRSGWHCSRYYQFSRLLGDGPFLDLVTQGLSSVYRSENFACVIGIGTAGAQLASRLALTLGARFAYTFGSAPAAAEPGLHSGPTDYELAIDLDSNARVLIVDDIIGKGTSLTETIARLRLFEPAYIRAFCVIATSDAAEMEAFGDSVQIDALALIPGVGYWSEDVNGFCQVCPSESHRTIRER